jgi:hypothetical protein
VGPHTDLKQGVDLAALFASGEGSQSAPIGIPLQRQICGTVQYLAAVHGWGPASVLKHIEIAANGNLGLGGEMREIVGILTTTTGTSFTGTLFARYRLSRLLFQDRRFEEARAEIEHTITDFDPLTDPCHCLLRSCKVLLNAVEGHPINENLVT